MHWTKKLTKTERTHLAKNCCPNEGLRNKALAIERAGESAKLGCRECQVILTKLTEEA